MTTDPAALLDRFAGALGPRDFNRLVDAVPRARQRGRLRYFEEQLLVVPAALAGVAVPTVAEFLALFGKAARRPIPVRPRPTREEYLREVEQFPYGLGGTADDPEAVEWAAAAWQVPCVRETWEYEFARSVSKVGSLAADPGFLALLAAALTPIEQLELFHAIRRESPFREAEFRPEFEAAFPASVPFLPDALTDEQLVLIGRGYGLTDQQTRELLG